MTSKIANIIIFIVLSSLITNCSFFGEGTISKFLPKSNSWFKSITKGKDVIKSAVSNKIPDVPDIASSESSHLENFLVDYICQPVAKVVYPVYDTVTRRQRDQDTIKSHVTETAKNLNLPLKNKGITAYLTHPLEHFPIKNPFSGYSKNFLNVKNPFAGYFNSILHFKNAVAGKLNFTDIKNTFSGTYENFFGHFSLNPLNPAKKMFGYLVPSNLEQKINSNVMHPLEQLNVKNPFSGYFKNIFQFKNPFAGFSKNFFEHLSLNSLKTVQKRVDHLMPSKLTSIIASKIAQLPHFFRFNHPLAGYSMNIFNRISFNPLKNIKKMLGHLVPSSLVKWVTYRMHDLVFFTCGVSVVVVVMLLYRCKKYIAGEYEMFEESYYIKNNEDTAQDISGDSETPSDIAETIKPKDEMDEMEVPIETKTSSTQTIKKDEKTSSTQTSETKNESSESQTDLGDAKDFKDQEMQTDISEGSFKRLSPKSSTRNNRIHPPAVTPNI